MLLLELYWSFTKIGFTSFGGISMVSLISDEMLAHGWLSIREISDIVAIAEMTPGPLGLNCIRGYEGGWGARSAHRKYRRHDSDLDFRLRGSRLLR